MTESDLTNLGNRVIDRQGDVVYFTDSLIDLMYNGFIPSEPMLVPEDDVDIKQFNKLSYENFNDVYFKNPTTIKTIEERRNTWFYPKEYDNIVLEDYFKNLLKKESFSENNIKTYEERILLEIKMYKERDFEKFLRFCIYFSDIIKKKDLVVGVGRGSSCASLLLYLLKIHLIDPIEYGLDIKEFLK